MHLMGIGLQQDNEKKNIVVHTALAVNQMAFIARTAILQDIPVPDSRCIGEVYM